MLRINNDEIQAAVEQGALALGARNQRIAEMRSFNSLVGFRDDEVPIFEQKLSFLAQQFNPISEAKTFNRILTISNFPDFRDAELVRVDANKLLEIRQSVECREFRRWISQMGSATNKKIEDQTNSLKSKLGNLIDTRKGKILRFLAGTGIGIVASPGVSIIFDALDSFLLDRVLPSNAPVAFLQRYLRSLFKDA